MRPLDDYQDDMIIGRLSDTDIENLLSGETPQGTELGALAHFVDAMRGQQDGPLDEEILERYAVEAAAIVRLNQPSRITSKSMSVAPKSRRSILRLRTKTATALVSLLVVGSMTGVAAAANGSGPGDLLYGLDLALEKLGIGAGGAGERLEEARALAAGGNAADALAHAAAAMVGVEDEDELSSSADALMSAAESVRSSGDETSQEVREKVAQLLEFLADNNDTLNGREVAERARAIGGHPQDVPPVDTPDDSGPGGDVPDPNGGDGPPDGVPPETPGPSVIPPVTTP